MHKLIAIAIVRFLLSQGVDKEDLSVSCHLEKVGVAMNNGKKSYIPLEACEVYVSKDHQCRAVYDHKSGFSIMCQQGKGAPEVETL